MSFGWSFTGKHGEDLLTKYGVNYQALGLGPNHQGATEAPHHVLDIRSAFIGVPYKDKLPEAAQDALRIVQGMVAENLASLSPRHCETCSCTSTKPDGWSEEAIKALLSIPVEEVQSASGGY